MKLNLTLLLSVFICLSLNAQIRKIPADVTDAFQSRYPHAERVSWKDELSSFAANFKLNDFEMNAYFASDGEWLLTQKKLQFDDLPAQVKDGFGKSKYTDWTLGSIFEINKNMEALQYRILVKKSGVQKKYLYFDASGKLNKESLTL